MLDHHLPASGPAPGDVDPTLRRALCLLPAREAELKSVTSVELGLRAAHRARALGDSQSEIGRLPCVLPSPIRGIGEPSPSFPRGSGERGMIGP